MTNYTAALRAAFAAKHEVLALDRGQKRRERNRRKAAKRRKARRGRR